MNKLNYISRTAVLKLIGKQEETTYLRHNDDGTALPYSDPKAHQRNEWRKELIPKIQAMRGKS